MARQYQSEAGGPSGRSRHRTATRLTDSGHQPLILDVRTNLVFALDPRTIPGAIRLTIDELDSKLAGVPREKEIALFCT